MQRYAFVLTAMRTSSDLYLSGLIIRSGTQPIDEALEFFVRRHRVGFHGLVEFFDYFALRFRDFLGHFDDYFDQLVARLFSVQARQSHAPHPQDGS